MDDRNSLDARLARLLAKASVAEVRAELESEAENHLSRVSTEWGEHVTGRGNCDSEDFTHAKLSAANSSSGGSGFPGKAETRQSAMIWEYSDAEKRQLPEWSLQNALRARHLARGTTRRSGECGHARSWWRKGLHVLRSERSARLTACRRITKRTTCRLGGAPRAGIPSSAASPDSDRPDYSEGYVRVAATGPPRRSPVTHAFRRGESRDPATGEAASTFAVNGCQAFTGASAGRASVESQTTVS